MIDAPGVDLETSSRLHPDRAVVESSPTIPIVCVGASAGGLKALSLLLAEIPDDTGMAFVVIQHLDPIHESQLPALLGKASRIPVEPAVDGAQVRANRVYVIMPNTRIGIEQGILRIRPREQGPRSHLTIDAFLGALATDRPGCAIGVILSGTGSDGTLGLSAIKAAGGITFAQDDTAEFTGMPLSAISHGCADFVLAPSDIAKEITKIARFGFPCLPALFHDDSAQHLPDSSSPLRSNEDPAEYARIIRLLHTATGIDFTHYRSRTIMRRTLRRMALVSKPTLVEYAQYLAGTPVEIDALAKDILINVTSFYRDLAAFESLKAVAFPALTSPDRTQPGIRLWVVGCSTGQEVYSLAIELVEHLKSVNATPQVQIFATDISDWALAKARLGVYGDHIGDEIPADRLARYFTKEAHGYRVVKEIRDLCVFAKHDVTADTPFSRIDIISCRNVLIYLGPVLQNYVLPTFHFSLNQGGFLLLGAAESLGRSANLYQTIDEKNRLYRAIAAPGRIRPTPVSTQRGGDHGMSQPPSSIIPSLSDIQRAADQVVLGRFAPAGVLVNDALQIIQFRGRTNPFLEPAQGEATLNLLTMVPFGVAEALGEALADAKQHNVPVRRDGIVHRREQAFRHISFEVIPIKLPTSATSFLILFEEERRTGAPPGDLAARTQPAPPQDAGDGVGPLPDPREVIQLRMELAAATDYIHSLVDLNKGLSEQLRDAKEEVQSSTEEYRSTNEELQTTKEEVESTNQELVTINDELRVLNTDLTKTAAALGVSADLTAAIIETMHSPLLVLAANLRVESANRAFLETFGVDRQETIGKLVYDLGNGQWNIPELRRLLEDILPNHSTFDDFEVTHHFRTIGPKTMLLNARSLKGKDEESRQIVLVIADITERTGIARTLQVLSDDLQRSNADLDQFATVASHDLQEPLRMITSYIGLLENRYEALFDDRARKYFAHVTDGARRMREMIKAILTYSQLGHQATNVVVIDSGIAFKNAIANLAVKIENAHAEVIGDKLPQVLANSEQLTQLLQNLINNAVKFRSKERTPIVRVTAAESAKEWTFSIADNGVGIDPAYHVKIFQLFQRVHGGLAVDGCGIGLATCKKIVEHHHGRIWVESKVGVGSTFFFTLKK